VAGLGGHEGRLPIYGHADVSSDGPFRRFGASHYEHNTGSHLRHGALDWRKWHDDAAEENKYFRPDWANVLTTSNSDARIPRTTETGCFRLQSQVTNTVLAFAVYLDGADEVPAILTSGKGIGALALEGSNLTYYVSFSGLSSPASLAHFHGAATPTNTANVLIGLSVPAATAGAISGNVVLTATR